MEGGSTCQVTHRVAAQGRCLRDAPDDVVVRRELGAVEGLEARLLVGNDAAASRQDREQGRCRAQDQSSLAPAFCHGLSTPSFDFSPHTEREREWLSPAATSSACSARKCSSSAPRSPDPESPPPPPGSDGFPFLFERLKNRQLQRIHLFIQIAIWRSRGREKRAFKRDRP